MLRELKVFYIKSRLEYHRYMFNYYIEHAGAHMNDLYVSNYLARLSVKHLEKILAYSQRLCNV